MSLQVHRNKTFWSAWFQNVSKVNFVYGKVSCQKSNSFPVITQSFPKGGEGYNSPYPEMVGRPEFKNFNTFLTIQNSPVSF